MIRHFFKRIVRETPFTHTVTIRSNTSLPNSLKDECKCFYVKPQLHCIGVIERSTILGNTVRCYDLKERFAIS